MSEYEDLGVTHTVEDNLYDGTGETFDSKLKTATQAGVSVPTMKSTFSAVNLSMGCFQNSKKDAKATQQIRVRNGLDADAPVFGVRTLLSEWVKAMSEIQQSHDESLEIFLGKYDEAVQSDQAMYRGLHNPDDYPTLQTLRSKFYFDYSFDRLMDDERTLLSDEAIGTLEEHYQNEHDIVLAKEREQYRNRMVYLKEEVWNSLRDALKKVNKQRYQDDDADVIRGAVDCLKTFNVDDDPVMSRVHDSLTSIFDEEFNMDKLRINDWYRFDIQDKTAQILKSLPSLD